MNKYICSSSFKKDIEDFLEYKVKNGHKENSYAYYLYRFDKYVKEKNAKNKLTKKLVEEWLVLGKNESKRTRSCRASIIKEFAKYLNNIKDEEAFIINSKFYYTKSTFIPHIYSDYEIYKFFSQIDITVNNNIWFPNNKQQIKLFFKILYCCGLRDSELLKLSYDNIDLENKCLIINESKNGISRLIYLNDDLINNLKNYKEKNDCNSNFVFYNNITKRYRSLQTIRDSFHKILKEANFDNKINYRIHDFRHTFAVKNLKQCYESGNDIYQFLPILMTYMGHSHIRSTEYYLRFTPDVYEKVTKQFEEKFKNTIPTIDNQNEK